MKEQTKNYLIITLLVVSVLLLIAFVGSTENTLEKARSEDGEIKMLNDKEIDEIKNEALNEFTWEDLEEEYMGGCNEDGNQEEFCSCTWNKIENKYTKEEFSNIALDLIQTGDVPNSFAQIAIDCSEYYK